MSHTFELEGGAKKIKIFFFFRLKVVKFFNFYHLKVADIYWISLCISGTLYISLSRLPKAIYFKFLYMVVIIY